ncbi:MAG: protein translocase subunit SecD [Caldilineaceae bacterium]|nr:protein translocase subunit SecD [Caldilineaceae bacterium]
MISLVIVVLLTLAALYIVLPVDHPAWLERSRSTDPNAPRELLDLRLGLDLRGGTQVLLDADLPEGRTLAEGDINAAKAIVENRVNGLGVAEAVVQVQGSNRLIVELPGISNADQAVETIRSTGQLEFVDPGGNTLASGMIINTTNHPNAVANAQSGIASGDILLSEIPYPDQIFTTAMTGDVLANATAAPNQFNQWIINFSLTSAGGAKFLEYTRNNIGRPMAIVLDGRVLSAPVINAAIGDSGTIEGSFTQQDAESLAIQMRYGALPVPLIVSDIRTIGASLGQDSVDQSVRAAAVGLVAIFIFMITIYRLPGLMAVLALVCYILFNLAVYKLIPITLTLPGIAGFILSIGMSLDANILVFERLKEELRVGRSLRPALESGFARAWPAIWDSNLSTMITCVVLFWFGNTFGASTVKGFAVTLAIGVGLSMFSAILITRTFMRALFYNSDAKLAESRNLMGY